MGKKSKSTSQTVYGNTTTTNPYVTSQTSNNGTVTSFNQGTAFDSINNFVNSNMGKLLDEYLNPTLESTTNQAKLNSYINTLNTQTAQDLENNIINPLSNRNMVRSSQATNMYNNLAKNNASSISNYANELLANSQSDTASLLSNLMLLYMNGYSAVSDNQKQSLSTSQGNATTTQSSSSSGLDTSDIVNLALQLAVQSLKGNA
jgi:hypothetical protein